jgi:hypothetical protein
MAVVVYLIIGEDQTPIGEQAFLICPVEVDVRIQYLRLIEMDYIIYSPSS